MSNPQSKIQNPKWEEHPEFNFEHDLPAGVESFALHWLAKRWKCSVRHLFKLVESGEFKVAIDLRGLNSSKACIRLPRQSVVDFLNRRKDLIAVAEANPQPAPRRKREETRKSERGMRNGKGRA